MTTRVLTGIKPTGTIHLGNLVGAIRPALRLADQGLDAMYFIADYHALTIVQPPAHAAADMQQLVYEIAAAWLAYGLDPDKVTFYRQSDIPELFELSWILQCFTSKGWMNKAHAYKALVADRSGDDVDAGINMGVYGYPILMAADIVAFDVDLVPVGKDQVQHVEIARDIALRINSAYGREVLRLPAAKIETHGAVVPGLDGRKMSKSYNNVIPLFAPPRALEQMIMKIATDSTPLGAPKDPNTSTVFQIYRAIATAEETQALAERYASGIGWGDAKRVLAQRVEAEVAPARAHFEALMADKAQIDALLAAGAAKARVQARRTLERVREVIGIALRA